MFGLSLHVIDIFILFIDAKVINTETTVVKINSKTLAPKDPEVTYIADRTGEDWVFLQRVFLDGEYKD